MFDKKRNQRRSGRPSIDPLWTIDLEQAKDDTILEWAKDAYNDLLDWSEPRIREALQNLAIFKGFHVDSNSINARQSSLLRDSEGHYKETKFEKIVVNHLHDKVESMVARMATFRPSTAVLPTHSSEFKDKAKAKVVKAWLDSIFYERNVDDMRRKAQRHALIFGEAFLLTEWNPDIGDIHPDARKAAAMGKEITVETEDGEKVKIPANTRTGDIDWTFIMPMNVFPEPEIEYERVDWIITREWVNVNKLRRQYPDKQDEIMPGSDDVLRPEENVSGDDRSSNILVLTIWHRSTREMPEGRKIVLTNDLLLENIELPYDHGKLPIMHLKALDVPGELHGRSIFTNLKQLQAKMNNLYTSEIRNASLAAPKFIVPAGSLSEKSIKTNDATFIQYKGGVAPRWDVPQLSNQGNLLLIDKFERLFEKLGNESGTRRGDSLPNVEAFKAFAFFEEEAVKRDSSFIAAHRDFLQRFAVRLVELAGQFYTNEDGRTIKMIGRHNKFLLRYFDTEDLAEDYHINVQNFSALPESKSARISTVVELSRAFPGMFTDEQITDMLELSTPDKFFNLAAVAVNAAEAENEDMMSGTRIADPAVFEEILQHWEIHRKQLNDPLVKDSMPRPEVLNELLTATDPDFKEEIIQALTTEVEDEEGRKKTATSPGVLLADHLNATEALMFERAIKNPAFAQRLSQVEMFPIFFNTPFSITEVLAQHQQALMISADPAGSEPTNLGTTPPPINPVDLQQ